MSYGLILFDDGLMSLRIVVGNGGLATIVKEELGLVKVFFVASHEVELCQSHLCNLVSWNDTGLSWVRAYLLTYDIGITDSDIQELTAACSLIVGDSTFHHVAEVIQFMAQIFLHAPTFLTSPLMRVLWILRAACIEIAVRLLCRSDDIEHRIDISHKFLVGIGLQDIAGTLDCLIRIGVVKGQTTYLKYF